MWSIFDAEVIDDRAGSMALRVTGRLAGVVFADEAGGHRWQRRPANDRHGRTHTSTVTVAVLPEPDTTVLVLKDADLDWVFKRGTGPGGQHKNKTESAVVLKHKPTGIVAQCQSERSQHANKASALAVLRARVWEQQRAGAHGTLAANRRAQVGSGQRGDKRRTIRVQDGQVHDHLTGRRWKLDKYLSGDWT